MTSTQQPVLSDPKRRAAAIKAFREHGTTKAAAAAAGVSRKTLIKYRATHPDFDERCRLAATDRPEVEVVAIKDRVTYESRTYGKTEIRKAIAQAEQAAEEAAVAELEAAERAKADAQAKADEDPEVIAAREARSVANAKVLASELAAHLDSDGAPSRAAVIALVWEIANDRNHRACSTALKIVSEITLGPMIAEARRAAERAHYIEQVELERAQAGQDEGVVDVEVVEPSNRRAAGLVILEIPKLERERVAGAAREAGEEPEAAGPADETDEVEEPGLGSDAEGDADHDALSEAPPLSAADLLDEPGVTA